DGQQFDADEVATYGGADPRAVATVALAPGAWYAFSPGGSGLAPVAAPLVFGATKDTDMAYATEAGGAYAAAGAPRSFPSLVDSGHWSFSDLCEIAPIEDCAGTAGGYMDPERAHALVRSRTLAHLDVHMLGETRDAPWLTGDAD